MNNDKHARREIYDKAAQYVTRDHIMKLLSDEELAQVSSAEGATPLADGDEYIDLEHLDRGVRKASGTTAATVVDRALPRKAVAEATWGKILVRLAKA